jgi:hypothetical protein
MDNTDLDKYFSEIEYHLIILTFIFSGFMQHNY